MISRPDDPYVGVKRTFRVALVVSLLIHPLIIAMLIYQIHVRSSQQIQARQKPAESETVTISSGLKRAKKIVAAKEPESHPLASQMRTQPKVVPKPARVPDQLARVIPKPVAKPVTVPTYPPLPHKHELAKFAPGTPVPLPEPTTEQTPKPTRRTPSPEMPLSKTVAALEKPSAAQSEAKAGTRHYSPDQLAQINSDLSKFTRSTRGSENPLSDVSKQTTVAEAPKHYAIDFRATSGNERGAQGVCDPISQWQMSGYDYYYLACNVLEPDGSMARKALPWPVRFRPSADPNLGNAPGGGPIALPLPGWHPPPGHPIDPDFVGYLRQGGYPI